MEYFEIPSIFKKKKKIQVHISMVYVLHVFELFLCYQLFPFLNYQNKKKTFNIINIETCCKKWFVGSKQKWYYVLQEMYCRIKTKMLKYLFQ